MFLLYIGLVDKNIETIRNENLDDRRWRAKHIEKHKGDISDTLADISNIRALGWTLKTDIDERLEK